MEVKARPTGALITRTNGLPLLTYREDGFQPIERYRLSDEEYECVLRSKTLANVDIVFINRARKTFYLARRVALPMQGWWWFGGNTGNINLPLTDALSAVLTREIGHALPSARMKLELIGEYFWKDRSQAPTNIGCHMCGLTFSAEVTDEEVALIKLDPKEYEEGLLREFTREDLVKEGVFPVIIDAYDLIFPPERFQHIVLIFYKEGVSDDAKKDMFNRYQALAENCGGRNAGILSWMVKENLDDRKGPGLVEVATFTDKTAFERFRSHPEHGELVNILKDIADWKVGDYLG